MSALPAATASAATTSATDGDGAPALVTINEEGLPVGVHADDPTDTASLRKASGIDAEETSTDGTPPSSTARSSSSYFPSGPSVIPGYPAHVAPACVGDGTDGRRVQVLYVREPGDTSRMEELRASFLNEVAQVDDLFSYGSAVAGQSRRVRWYSDSTCQPVIQEVVLASGGLSADHASLSQQLRSAGYNNGLYKYLVFAEGTRLGGRTCGLGNFYQDVTPGPSNYNNGGVGYIPTVARVDAICWFSNSSQAVTTHELIHTLGGVMGGAPNATLHGHCTDAGDPMCYDDGSGMPMRSVCSQTGAALQLDCNKDDYFNVAPPAGSYLAANWNTANSMFLTTVADPGDPWASAQMSVNPSPAMTGVDASVLITGAPEGTTVSWSQRNTGCTLKDGGSSTWGIRGVLNCSVFALPSSSSTGTVPVVATLTNPTLPTTSRTLNVRVDRSARPVPVVTPPAEIRANVPTTITATAPGVGPLTWTWTAFDGGSCILSGQKTPSVTITCPDASAGKTLSINVTAESADYQNGGVLLQIPVTEQYQTSAAIVGPTGVKTGTEYTYTAVVKDPPPDQTVAYSWTDSKGAIISRADQDTVVVKPTSDGLGTLTLTATVSTTSSPKTLTTTRDYTATTAYTVAVTASRESVTSGSSVTFTATPSGGPLYARSDYQWKLSGAAFAADCATSTNTGSPLPLLRPAPYSGQMTPTVTATNRQSQETATGSHTVQVTEVPFTARFSMAPTSVVANNQPGTFTVSASAPATFGWVATPASCVVVVSNVYQTPTSASAQVTCPVSVSGAVGLQVTAKESGSARSQTISSSMQVAEAPRAPLAPANVSVTAATTTTMNISWSKSAGASGYVIRYDNSAGVTTVRTVGDGSWTSLTGLTPSSTYVVSVSAVGNGQESPRSPTVTGTTLTPPPPPPVPAAPGGVKMKTRTVTTMTPQWSKSAYATSYIVYYGTKSNGASAAYKTVGNVAYYKLTGLRAGTRYYVRVVAVSATAKRSGYSSLVGMTTVADHRPGKPGTPRLLSRSGSTLKFYWARPSYAYRYRFYYGTRSDGRYARYKNVKLNSYTLSGLSRHKKYYVSVVAYSEGGLAGPASTRVSGTTS
ncbi:fibronectin type III domain-containing protein [Aeromicrobium sp.]|uniref:fibronectin type III domain-containing protein n=1 Tax=Aeromicrobium sp. TaxID=1871063 RepID=UPI0019B2DAFC|nr:fibronectin type III domain-containing protein [Aeromicrobium sp.]MBC7630217.1 fibronectin type III domain-containing protein [Aeromicrobium sp.]